MATFQTRVEDLIGSIGDTQLISDSLTDTAAEIIALLPKECLWVASVNSGDVTALNYNVEKCIVLNVIRENGTDGQYEDCKEVNPSYFRRVQDVNSMWYPSSSEPVYLVKNSHVFVYPTPGVSPNAFQVEYVTNPSVAYGGTSITNFPDEYEHLVVLGGTVRCLQRLMNNDVVDLSSITIPTVPSISNYVVIATAPSLPSEPAIASPGVSTSTVSFTTSPPTYVVPTVPIGLSSFTGYTSGLAESDPGAFVVGAILPPSPGLPTISYANASVGDAVSVAVDSIRVAVDSITGAQDGISVAQDAITGAVDGYTGETDTAMAGSAAGVSDTEAPTNAAGVSDAEAPTDAVGITTSPSTLAAYVKPVVQDSSGASGSLTNLLTLGVIGDDADQLDFDTWWELLGDYIEDDEDTELAQMQMQKIRTYIDAFQAEVQSASAAMQATIEDARSATQASVDAAQNVTKASIANAANDVSTNNASIASLTQASIANASNDVSTNNASIASLTQTSIATHQADTTIKGAGIGSLTSAKVAKMQQSTSASITKMRESTSAATAKMQQSTSAAIAKMQQSTAASSSKMQLSTQASIEKMRQSSNINLQNAAKTLEASIQDYSQEVALYRARVDGYQADVSKEIQAYQQQLALYQLELSTSAQNWSSEQVQKIQKYQAEQQDSLQEFNQNNVEYQAQLQRSIQQAQINATEYIKEGDLTIQASIQDYVQTLNRFAEDVKKYQAEINKELQTWQGNTNKTIEVFTVELQAYQAEIATEMQEKTLKLQQYVRQYDQLKAEYERGLQALPMRFVQYQGQVAQG